MLRCADKAALWRSAALGSRVWPNCLMQHSLLRHGGRRLRGGLRRDLLGGDDLERGSAKGSHFDGLRESAGPLALAKADHWGFWRTPRPAPGYGLLLEFARGSGAQRRAPRPIPLRRRAVASFRGRLSRDRPHFGLRWQLELLVVLKC